MNGIITSNAMYGEVGKAINDEINNSHNAIIVGLKGSYEVTSGEISQTLSGLQEAIGESSETAVLNEDAMSKAGENIDSAGTTHEELESAISDIYGKIKDIISLSSPKSSVKSDLSNAKKVLTDAIDKVNTFDGSGQEPQATSLLAGLNTWIEMGNQVQGLSYTDPVFTEFAAYSVLADAVQEIDTNIEASKAELKRLQEQALKEAEEKAKQEEEEWAKHHPVQAWLKSTQEGIGDWWEGIKRGTKEHFPPVLRELTLFVEGAVGAAGSFVGDTVYMATDLALFSLESTAVFYGGMADSLLGTKMVPQWMKDDVDGFNNTLASAGKFAVDFVADEKVRNQALDSMGKALHEGWDNFWADPAYNLGGAAFDIGSMLIGAGEIKAGLTAAKGSASFAKGVAAFGKAAGKAALKNADNMARGVGRMISRGDDLTRKMAGKLKNKMVAFGDDLAGTASAGAQAVKQSLRQAADGARSMLDGRLTAQEAFALATGSLDDFNHHGAKVYNLSDDVARQTGRVSSRFSTEAVEGGVGHADDVQGLLKGTGETAGLKAKSTIPPIEESIPRLDEVTVEFKYKQKFDEKEFARQLSGQEEGLNNLTVQEYFDNRERYLREGRSKEAAKAQRRARKQAYDDRVFELINEGEPPNEARAKAKEWLKEQAALHDPDQIAGGNPTKISGVGDRRVNSSLGSQWRTRIDEMDTQIREFAKGLTPEELQNTYLNIKLSY